MGCAIARLAAPQNPYRAWVDTYADEGFGETVRAVIATADLAAETVAPPVRARMLTAFGRAVAYEYLFWDGAYQQRRWPSTT